jgi:hypothetical protein
MNTKRNKLYQDRDELAQWFVSTWQDAIAEKFTQAVLLKKWERIYNDPRWKRIPQYQREYVHGFSRCYEVNVVDRQFLEHGSWVRMPDGSVEWFGVAERLGKGTMELNALYPQLAEYGIHRYIHENEIPERAGIYWVADSRRGVETKSGEKPYFIPTLDFDQAAFDARMKAQAS